MNLSAKNKMPPLPATLSPGDILLYGDASFSLGGLLGRLIRFRTWADVSHVEIYIGGIKTVTSRAAGPGIYDFYSDSLRRIIRPLVPLDIERGLEWLKAVDHLPYGYLDLFRFYGLNVKTKGMICSQTVDLFLQACGAHLFNPFYPEGAVTPRDYELIPPQLANQVWSWKPGDDQLPDAVQSAAGVPPTDQTQSHE